MEATQNFNDFINQPNQVDKDFFEKVISKNLELFKNVEKLVNDRLGKEFKFEKDIKKKNDDLEKIREKRQKETDDLEDKIYKEKIERLKKEKKIPILV